MSGALVVINAGSSSIKFCGYEVTEGADPMLLFKGQIEGIGRAPHMSARDAGGKSIAEKRWPAEGKWTHETLLGCLFDWVAAHLGGRTPIGVGHRVVHGGTAFAAATPR